MNYTILDKETLFDDFFKVEKIRLNHDTFEGGQLTEVQRYHLRRPDAAAIILENVDTNKVILIEQFRYAASQVNHRKGWAIEIIAGIIEAGETAESTAAREALEEAGYSVTNLEFIMKYLTSIGVSNEMVYLYYAQVSEKDRIGKGGGLEQESEDIKVIEKTMTELSEGIATGQIMDSKTIIAAQWLMQKKGVN